VLETVTLTQLDTLPGILSRLRNARGERVLFVVPAKSSLDALDLRILRREAAAQRKSVALLTSSGRLRTLAAAEGISTFRIRWWAERVPWRSSAQPAPSRQPPTGAAVPEAPFGAGLMGRRSPSGFQPAAFLRAFVRRQSPWWATLGLSLYLLALSASLLYALALVIPSATITLIPAAEPLQVTVPLVAIQDAVADANAGIVPGRALSAQVSGDARAPTTGRRFEPAAKATGRVVMANRTNREVTIPLGAVVATATGNNVRFATTADIILAPGGRATVPAEAVLPGLSGNVRAGTITQVEGALALSIVVANDEAFSGGTMAQVGVVTEQDKTQLQAKLFDELKLKAFERLNERLEPGSFVPADSVTFMALSPTFTPFVGEVSPELYLSMSVQGVGLMVDGAAADRIALTWLRQAMPPGTRLISDTIRFIPGAIHVKDARTISFTMLAEGVLLRGVGGGSVRSAMAGMKPEQALSALQERFGLTQPPRIHLGPDWLPYIEPTNIPILPWRIRVEVDWDGGATMAARRR